jgi:hypothetical protein
MGDPGGSYGDTDLVSVVRGALEQLAVAGAAAIAEAAALHRDHPRWAVWLPVGDCEWAAMRPAGSRPPAPEMPMVWVRGSTAAELSARMRQADGALAPPELPARIAGLALPPPRQFRRLFLRRLRGLASGE